MRIRHIETAVVTSGIVAVVDGDIEAFLAVTGNTGDHTCSKGFQPSVWCDFEIDTMMEEVLAGQRMRLLAIAQGDFQWAGLRQLERHGIAARGNEVHCMIVFHCGLLIG